MARQLSTDGNIRGPETSPGYPEHVHPAEGPYTDVHVETAITTATATVVGMELLEEIFAPTLQEIADTPGPEIGDLLSAAAWDFTSTVDPTGITDLIHTSSSTIEVTREKGDQNTSRKTILLDNTSTSSVRTRPELVPRRPTSRQALARNAS